jgi:hypothetical protein
LGSSETEGYLIGTAGFFIGIVFLFMLQLPVKTPPGSIEMTPGFYNIFTGHNLGG